MSEDVDQQSELERQLEARDILGVRSLIQQGIEIEAFFRSEVGKYLRERAASELVGALQELMAVDPKDAAAVAQAQFNARVPGAVMAWLTERLAECQNAERQYIAAADAAG